MFFLCGILTKMLCEFLISLCCVSLLASTGKYRMLQDRELHDLYSTHK
jgi:hypothetical protein